LISSNSGMKEKRASGFLNPELQGYPICIIEDMALKNYSNIVNKIVLAPVFIKNTNCSPVTVYGLT